jgi:hypothetical protein
VEELLEVLQIDDDDSHSSSGSSTASEDDLMLLAPLAAPSKPKARQTMRLHGMVGKQHILILVDSGANASFISTDLSAQLGRELQDTTPACFVAANGAPLVSSQKVP